MTSKINPQSGHIERARIFASAMQAARRRNRVGTRVISESAGVSRTLVLAYLRGDNIPSIAVAERLADALAAPELLQLARQSRIRACKRCRKEIAVSVGRPPVFCSNACRSLSAPAKREADPRKIRILTDEVRSYRNRIADMCAACPDGEGGVCKGYECPLRPVSPLRLEAIDSTAARRVSKVHGGAR